MLLAHAFDRNFILTVAGQYTDQRAVGDTLLGGSKFKRWVTTWAACAPSSTITISR
jgi:hypothetical protein